MKPATAFLKVTITVFYSSKWFSSCSKISYMGIFCVLIYISMCYPVTKDQRQLYIIFQAVRLFFKRMIPNANDQYQKGKCVIHNYTMYFDILLSWRLTTINSAISLNTCSWYCLIQRIPWTGESMIQF